MVEGPDFGSRSGHSYTSRIGGWETCVTEKGAVMSNFEVDRCRMDGSICVGIERRKFCGPRV